MKRSESWKGLSGSRAGAQPWVNGRRLWPQFCAESGLDGLMFECGFALYWHSVLLSSRNRSNVQDMMLVSSLNFTSKSAPANFSYLIVTWSIVASVLWYHRGRKIYWMFNAKRELHLHKQVDEGAFSKIHSVNICSRDVVGLEV